MDRSAFDQELRRLMTLDESESPVVSVFYDLEDRNGRRELRDRASHCRRALDAQARPTFDQAWERCERFIDWELPDGTRSVALFARRGSRPVFIPMAFEATLPTRMFVETTPVIFHLVELKDNYDRYVLLIAGEAEAQVVEVSLGTITRQLWARRPELRRRIGREWTRRHYLNHRRARQERFVKEKIALLDRLVRAGGHSHIMLAGNPRLTAQIRRSLPSHLAKRLLEIVPAASRDRTEDVVASTLSTFVEQEELESQAIVDQLRENVLRGGLAVVGVEPCRNALEDGYADVLVLTSDYGPEQVRTRERLLRLAQRSGVSVEVVQESEFLESLGGVGCLLRYPARFVA